MSCHGSQTPGPSGAAPRVLGMCQERGITFWGLWAGSWGQKWIPEAYQPWSLPLGPHGKAYTPSR